MKKHKELVIMLTAFLVGQLIQMLFIAVATNLYVAYPVRWCVSAGMITALLVVATVVVTVGVIGTEGEHTAEEPKKSTYATPHIPDEDDKIRDLFKRPRLPLETEPEDIDEIDKNIAKEARN